MKADAHALLSVATSVADGTDVDWGSLEDQDISERERALLRSLRVIASIGELHRSTDEEPESDALVAARGRIVGRIGPSPRAATPNDTAPDGPVLPTGAGPALPGRERSAAPGAPPAAPGSGGPPVVRNQAAGDLPPIPARWGHLVIRDRVGAGMFGEVYRAYDEQLQREVALKLLRPGTRTSERLAAKVLQEGRALARVRHPNIVTIHGVESHGARVGLWMEFIRGNTLEQLLQRQGLFGAREAALLGQDLCRALAAVHAAGLIHRDVKAQNVMREEGGRVVLMDFGTGVAARDEAASGNAAGPLAGTPLYLAPEVLAGGEATPASDLYSLGVLLYHLVTRAYPVTGASLDELRTAHAAGGSRRRLHDARPDLPDAFVQVVERALAPQPADRFPSAGVMQEALTRALAIDTPPSSDGGAQPLLAAPAVAPASTARDAAMPPRGQPLSSTAWLALIATGLALAAAAGIWLWKRPPVVAGPVNSVIVLPLANVSSGDRDLAEGVDLLVAERLAMLPNLRVVQYTSSMASRDKGLSIPEIIRRQQVDGALSGTVAWTGPRAQVNVNLIRAGSTAPLWVKQFDVPARQAPDLPRDVAREVVSALAMKLSPADETRMFQTHSAEPDVFESYLRGRIAMRAGNVPGIKQAVTYFQAALVRDPQHAPSLAALSRCYIMQAVSQRVRPLPEASTLARDAVTRALQVDERLPDAYQALAEVRFYFDWDWTGADEAYRRALDLSPNSGEFRSRYAMFLASRKRLPDAMQQVQQAVSLDPMSSLANASLGILWHYARSDDQAEQIYRGVLESDPTFLPARLGLVRTLLSTKRYDEALKQVERIEADAAGQLSAGQQGLKGLAYAGLGRVADAQQVASALTQHAVDAPSVDAASIYAALGDRARALDILEQAVDSRQPAVLFLRLDPRFMPLQRDPRFTALVRRLGIAS